MNVRLLDDNTIGVFFSYEPYRVQMVKALAGARYEPTARFWYFPIDGVVNDNLDILTRAGFAIDDQVRVRVAEFAKPISQDFASELPLYPFQREIANFMFKTGNCLNASFVGSGKTLTSLAVCEALKAKRVLIIVPKSVLMQWATVEIPKWLPNASVIAVFGAKDERESLFEMSKHCQYTVIGYETARIEIERLIKTEWDVIICDEAHRLANTRTETYKAFKLLRAKNKFALTATPVMNKPEDMFGIINFLRPGALGSWYQFMNRYVVKDQWGSPKFYKNMGELAMRCKPYIIRKTLEETDMQLPDYTEAILPVELGTKERKNYDLIKKELLFEIEPLIISKIENPVMLQSSIVKLGKLFEVCDSLELIGGHTDSSKLELLKEHLEGTLINGQKAIIITRFSRMAEILYRHLADYGATLITGQTKDRQGIIKNFESSPTARILVGTESISQGLNLQFANILYNYDTAWNPARMEQRAGRIYRNGQEKPVFIYNLVCQKTVEVWLQKKLEKKQELSDKLLPKSFVELKEMLNG